MRALCPSLIRPPIASPIASLVLSLILTCIAPGGAVTAQTVTLPRLSYPEPAGPVDCRTAPTDPACLEAAERG